MITIFNSFISYLIVVIVSMGIIVLAVLCGKKLRDAKDKKDALKAETETAETETADAQESI